MKNSKKKNCIFVNKINAYQKTKDHSQNYRRYCSHSIPSSRCYDLCSGSSKNRNKSHRKQPI